MISCYNRIAMKTADFVFLVHSRDRTDLPRKFPILKYLPNSIFDWLTMSLPPLVVSKVTGLASKTGKPLMGVVIGIPMTARQLLEHRNKALKRILQSVNLAKKKGAKYIALGAMTASLSKGGKDIIERIKDVYVTTGRTYTVKNITEYIEDLIKRFSIDRGAVRIGIVGAAGGIGSGVAMSLAKKGYKRLFLIDLERKLIHLKRHIGVLEKDAAGLNIEISHKVSTIVNCDIIVAATSSPEIVIESYDVSPGTIIINDAQPSDVSPEIIKNRNDVLVIEGGVLRTRDINCHFDFGLAHRNDIFSCLAEALILARMGEEGHQSLEGFDQKLYEIFQREAEGLGFSLSAQNTTGIIDNTRFQEFSKILEAKRSGL